MSNPFEETLPYRFSFLKKGMLLMLATKHGRPYGRVKRIAKGDSLPDDADKLLIDEVYDITKPMIELQKKLKADMNAA